MTPLGPIPRSIAQCISAAILVTALALAGDTAIGEPTSDAPDPGQLWAAMGYCRAYQAKSGTERRQYAEALRALKRTVWKLPPDEKQNAFNAKKSINHSGGTFLGRKLDPQRCAKLLATVELPKSKPKSKPKPKPAESASPESTGQKQ